MLWFFSWSEIRVMKSDDEEWWWSVMKSDDEVWWRVMMKSNEEWWWVMMKSDDEWWWSVMMKSDDEERWRVMMKCDDEVWWRVMMKSDEEWWWSVMKSDDEEWWRVGRRPPDCHPPELHLVFISPWTRGDSLNCSFRSEWADTEPETFFYFINKTFILEQLLTDCVLSAGLMSPLDQVLDSGVDWESPIWFIKGSWECAVPRSTSRVRHPVKLKTSHRKWCHVVLLHTGEGPLFNLIGSQQGEEL